MIKKCRDNKNVLEWCWCVRLIRLCHDDDHVDVIKVCWCDNIVVLWYDFVRLCPIGGWSCTDILMVDDVLFLGLVCWWFGILNLICWYIDFNIVVSQFWYIE